jgi:inosine/xanthosine triphosphatase
MKIAVGSRNPVKLAAVRNVMRRVYPAATIVPADVRSGVSPNPLSDEEAIRGAVARAKRAAKAEAADLGIGMEGSTTVIDGRLMTAGWAAVYDGKRCHVGGGGHVALPRAVRRRVMDDGAELGAAMDELTGGKNTKQKMGAIGILTGGLSSRQLAYEYILTYALAPLLSPQYYRETRQKKNRLKTAG